MAFKGGAFNHFMREAKREYNLRRHSLAVRDVMPMWYQLTDAQRMEWAQYMHDEWLNREPVQPSIWDDAKPEYQEKLWTAVDAKGKVLSFDPADINDPLTFGVKPIIDPIAVSRNGKVSMFFHDAERKADIKELVDLYVSVANDVKAMSTESNERYAEVNKTFTQDREYMEWLVEGLHRRVTALEQPFEVVTEDKSEVRGLRKQGTHLEERIAKLRAEKRKLTEELNVKQVALNNQTESAGVLRNLLDKKNGQIDELMQEIESRKKTEETLRKVQDELSQQLSAECNNPRPYAISRGQYEDLTRKRREQWYTSVKFIKYDFTFMPVVQLTDEQYVRVSGLARFEKL